LGSPVASLTDNSWDSNGLICWQIDTTLNAATCDDLIIIGFGIDSVTPSNTLKVTYTMIATS